MRLARSLALLASTGLLLMTAACGQRSSTGGGAPVSGDGQKVGKYTLVATMTDDAKQEKCKQNVEDTLVKHPDARVLVGLWAYNPPAMLTAVKDAKKEGKIAIVGFDENEETLQGIKDGFIHGTIVQQPYQFGYQAVRVMAELARGNKKVLTEPHTENGVTYEIKDGIMYVPHLVIKKNNVEEFHANLKKLKNPETPAPPPSGDPAQRVKVAFITNNPYEFWTIAKRGTEAAAAKFNADVEFYMPPRGTAAEQKAAVEDLLAKGVKAIAISPNDAANQAEFLNQVADKIPVLTQDSDLPKGSKRLCYIGTNNVAAGRSAGELVKEAAPEGGKLFIYVGKLDVQNAVERRQGVIEALRGQ
jgi:ribose transport system substrate-binding protein